MFWLSAPQKCGSWGRGCWWRVCFLAGCCSSGSHMFQYASKPSSQNQLNSIFCTSFKAFTKYRCDCLFCLRGRVCGSSCALRGDWWGNFSWSLTHPSPSRGRNWNVYREVGRLRSRKHKVTLCLSGCCHSGEHSHISEPSALSSNHAHSEKRRSDLKQTHTNIMLIDKVWRET